MKTRMSYLPIRQTSEKWNISARWINDLYTKGRILGATKIVLYRGVPEDAEKTKEMLI